MEKVPKQLERFTQKKPNVILTFINALAFYHYSVQL